MLNLFYSDGSYSLFPFDRSDLISVLKDSTEYSFMFFLEVFINMDLKNIDVIILDFNSHSIATVGTGGSSITIARSRPIFPILNECFSFIKYSSQINLNLSFSIFSSSVSKLEFSTEEA